MENNVPKLRFPEFEGEWRCDKLSMLLVEGRLGGNYDNSESNKGIPVIKMGNIGRGNIVLDKIQSLPDDQTYNPEDVLLEGDLLFNTRNTLDLVGKVAIWRNELPFALYNSNLLRLKFNNRIDNTNRYMNYFFNTKKTILQLRSFATGTTSVAAIYSRDLNQLKIQYPSLPEQTKIANFLTAVDDRINQLKKKKELLEQHKKGVMQQIFSQQLRFKDENGEDFPEWKEKNGNELFENISDKNHNSDLPILAITQDKGAIPRDLIDYNITVTDKSVESYKVVQIGDFIISLRSFQGGIEYSEYKGICSPAYIILRPKAKIDRRFYKYFLKTTSYIKQLNLKLEGIRDGKMISYKYFSETQLPYPSLPEQIKIANFLSAIDEKISHCGQQKESMERWKKGLLQQMFV
jgi:type I restriction enzyme S subunit